MNAIAPTPAQQTASETYWADAPADELVGHLTQKAREFFTALDQIGMRLVWRCAYSQNFGMDPSRPGHMDAQQIGFAGEQGEDIVFRINDFRSFVKQSVTLAIGQRPAYRCLAVNDDYESLAQIEACDSALSYIAHRAYGEDLERAKVEKQKLFGWAWDWHRWDDTGGDDVEAFEEPEAPIATSVRSGAPTVTPLSPYQVAHDVSVRDGRHKWVIVAEQVSKWELAAEYPVNPLTGEDQVESIIGLSSDETHGFTLLGGVGNSTDFMCSRSSDAVTVRHFYHARTRALPDGRYVGVAGDIVLWDLPLPSEELPCVLFMPSKIDGTSFGYSDAWDWLPIQQMLDQIVSDRATNVAAFGRPNLYMDEGTTMTVDLLAKGGQLFTKPAGTEAPGVVQYPAMNEGADKLAQYLQSRLRENSGQNAVLRGDPGSNIKSGTFAALMHAQAMEYNSADQQAVDASREANGNRLLESIKQNARHPFLVEVAGESEMPYAQTFESDRFSAVKRVQVVTANPMQRTVAGRMELLEQLLKIPGAISDPSQITEIMRSGQHKPMYAAGRNIKLGVRWENEQLGKGIPIPPAMAGENPNEMLEHAALLRIPSVRNNPQAVQLIQEHLMSHMQAALVTNPLLASSMGWQAPSAMMGMGGPPPGGPAGGPGGDADLGAPKGEGPGSEPGKGGLGVALPKPAKSPVSAQNAPAA